MIHYPFSSHPSFAALSNLNSTTLPANFVLKLPKPIPMAVSLIKKINNVTNGSMCIIFILIDIPFFLLICFYLKTLILSATEIDRKTLINGF